MRAQFLTAVWGDWHTSAFLRMNLPSLLATRNLPKFQQVIPSIYHIFTSSSDAKKVREAPSFRELERLMPVALTELPNSDFGQPVETHTRIWRNSVDHARSEGAFFTTIPADMVWSNGSLASLAARLAAGYRAVYAMFIRVVDETFSPEFQARFNGTAGFAASLTSRELMEMTLRHLHPLHCAYLRDSGYFPFHPEYVFWPVKREGFVMRSLATTVLSFDPNRFDINHQYSLASFDDPREVAFIDDSDEMHGVSITPLLKDRNWYTRPARLDIDEVGAWWINFDGPAHGRLASRKFRFHMGAMSEEAWLRAEAQSSFLIVQSLLAREMIRIGRWMTGNAHERAAMCLATAYYCGRLRRKWTWSGPVTIFCPTDAAFSDLTDDEFETLLAAGNETALLDFIKAHVVNGRLDLGTGDADGYGVTTTTVGQQQVEIAVVNGSLRVNGHEITARHDLPHGHIIYEIDVLLYRIGSSRQSADLSSAPSHVTQR